MLLCLYFRYKQEKKEKEQQAQEQKEQQGKTQEEEEALKFIAFLVSSIAVHIFVIHHYLLCAFPLKREREKPRERMTVVTFNQKFCLDVTTSTLFISC
ncbi:unnamed protein product [Cylicostephanus goldi]|uniref:Uncharacterized protein n=1 Tax=Cylicostephanus goldi TaxID=71465 RepID=A0A3P7MZE2_CYLGO|nr:unnamed protein product [Cylicostephanus goldi]